VGVAEKGSGESAAHGVARPVVLHLNPHPSHETKAGRIDWIRTKAPFEAEYAFGWRTEAVGKEGAFHDDYRM
jgi:hypothetical protein